MYLRKIPSAPNEEYQGNSKSPTGHCLECGRIFFESLKEIAVRRKEVEKSESIFLGGIGGKCGNTGAFLMKTGEKERKISKDARYEIAKRGP